MSKPRTHLQGTLKTRQGKGEHPGHALLARFGTEPRSGRVFYRRRKPAMVFRAYESHKSASKPMINICPTTGKL
jgi:hypothetical protein